MDLAKKPQEGGLATNFHVMNYLLRTYATRDVIAEAEAKSNNFRRKAGIIATSHTESI